MTACPACGGAEFEWKRYLCPPGPLTAKRRAFDAVQWAGWRILPLEALPLASARRFAQGLFKFRSVRRCLACGQGAIDPMCSESDLARFYEYFYIAKPGGVLPPVDARGLSQAHYLFEHIDMAAISATFEFGAGTAALSRALKERAPHISITVAELSRDMLQVLQSDPEIGRAIAIHHDRTEEFDLIMASHALEHVVDVVATLRAWVSVLRPGGVLFVEVPHASDDHYATEHEYIPHTWFFTSDSLDRLARAAGLATIALESGGPTYPEAIAGAAAAAPEDWHRSGTAGAQLRGLWRKPLSGAVGR